jgi:diacylglycerol kinase
MARQSLAAAFRVALRGIGFALRHERNFQIECVAAVLALIAGGICKLSQTEWLLVIVCIGFVLSAEGFNIALESLVDLVSPGLRPLAGQAKDVAAGAVLLSAFVALMVGAILFVPKLLALCAGGRL